MHEDALALLPKSLEWEEVISDSSPWAFIAVGGEAALDGFALQAPGSVHARLVRGKNCRDERSLFREWAAALQFPYYFGNNWDAFDECMNDLEWLNDRSVVVLVARAVEVLAEEPDRFEGTLMEILASATRTPGVPPGPSQSIGIVGPSLMRTIFHAESLEPLMAKLGSRANDLAVRTLPSALD